MNNLVLLTIAILSLSSPFIQGFSSFQLPIRLPWDAPATSFLTPKSPIRPNDKVVIFGATGGVGQLVTKKLLLKGYKVCVVARDEDKARGLLLDEGDGDDIKSCLEVAQLNLVGDGKASDEELQEIMKDANAIVISVGTTAFPTTRWSNGNTPQAIDCDAVSRIANLATSISNDVSKSSLRRIVLLTSVGVTRTNEMPFKILNLFGVLDAKRSGEDAVKAACGKANVSYSIIRPGRLVGGPYTNLDLAKLFQIEGGAENGVTLQYGDALLGDCKRDACAEGVVQALENESCVDVEFSVISNEEKALSTGEWGEAFEGMRR
ncbi:hypothetical protein HJC23_000634 [Cyclotella cryptica]|uniref:NAD(P)-binding domain-containing protein n=1 Tax=Cyclotella cryptica TaxID=29204 RepID=A0ABD3Q966_9STRA|eukprot:CCRYP_008029-RA/>CCRYP_008029-RA protein AED:0.03 eAED:0.03 QI:177/1/1/1/1/1/2/405/319